MKHGCRILISLLIVCSVGVTQSFTNLDSIVLGVSDIRWFGGQSYHLERMVLFDRSISTIIQDSSSADTTSLIVTRIDRNSPNKFFVKYWPGPSEDPMYIFYSIENNDTVHFGKLAADKIIVPGNGFIYTEQRSDKMFNRKRKFMITDDKFVEVKQPFYWVGIKSKLVQGVALYSDTCMVDPVASLVKGQEVLVLVNSGDYYLIKTPLGLTGWVQIRFNNHGTIIYDIFVTAD